MAILIKRYANRKLYNTDTSRYITLKGIARLLEEGEEVRVIDKESGEDITQVALSQILVENQRDKEDPSNTLLTQILSKGGDALYGAIKKSVDDATEGIGDFQDRFRSFVDHSESIARGETPFGFDGWEPRDAWQRRSPFSSDSSEKGEAGEQDDSPNHEETRSDHAKHGHSTKDGDARQRRENSWAEELTHRIRGAVDAAFATRSLPSQASVDELNQNLTRVADAIEGLERRLAQAETPDGDAT